jgi:hypothetical protein
MDDGDNLKKTNEDTIEDDSVGNNDSNTSNEKLNKNFTLNNSKENDNELLSIQPGKMPPKSVKEREEMAAINIQSKIRQQHAKKEVAKLKECKKKEESAALVIQRQARRRSASKKVENLKTKHSTSFFHNASKHILVDINEIHHQDHIRRRDHNMLHFNVNISLSDLNQEIPKTKPVLKACEMAGVDYSDLFLKDL